MPGDITGFEILDETRNFRLVKYWWNNE
jgi:hypothetical protein